MGSLEELITEFSKFQDIQFAFAKTCREKLYFDGYVDLADVYDHRSRGEIIKDADARNSFFYPVYRENFMRGKKTGGKTVRADAAIKLLKDKLNARSLHRNMSVSEAKIILNWVLYVFSSNFAVSNEFIKLFQEIVSNSKFFKGIEHKDLSVFQKTIIYDPKSVKPIKISSVTEYFGLLGRYCADDAEKQYFFRGHAKVNYQLLPGIFRKDSVTGKYQLKQQEKRLYNEIQVKCPEDFDGVNSHLEKLAIMQHYGLPTRLMDISFNPLVALFFAVRGQDDNIGEVMLMSSDKEELKWPNSDTASILSSLVALSDDDKNTLSFRINSSGWNRTVLSYSGSLRYSTRPKAKTLTSEKIAPEISGRLLGEIRFEKPGFQDEIHIADMFRKIPVLVEKKNQRIVRQNGGFILFGLPQEVDVSGDEKDRDICIAPCYDYRITDGDKVLLITVTNKAKIRKELKLLNISEETLFPEIEDVALAISKG